MSLVVNNNMMAANTARNLNAHYGRLATSTQRLSSGLRVNSAADDAAGLAIRELQRADIAALHQGARNANDAISMIQVADGSLGIIDEKLIRMKELAEQAATGTYDSTQRLMIESEYQAMASEITRIANATDFNGTKLLDGTLSGDHDGSKLVSEGKIKIHFGTGNDSAEDYYYIEIGECTSEAFGLGNNSTWKDVQNRGTDAFRDSLIKQIKNDTKLTTEEKGKLLAQIDDNVEALNNALANATDYKEAHKLWANDGTTGFLKEGMEWVGNSSLMADYLAAAAGATTTAGPSDPAEIQSKITNAIANVIPAKSDSDLTTLTAADFANVWTDVENAAKQAAKDAGFNDEELHAFLYDKDSGLQGKWDEQVKLILKNDTPVTNYEYVKAALIGGGNALALDANNKPAETAVPAGGAVKNYLDAQSPEVDVVPAGGTQVTNGEVIAYRNKAYNNYAAETKYATEPGPTTAEGVVAGFLAANEKAFAKAAEKAFKDDGTAASPAEQVDAFKKGVESMVETAISMGFTKEEATNIIEATANKVFLAAAGNVADFDAVIANGTTLDKDDWTALKGDLDQAIESFLTNTPKQAWGNAPTAPTPAQLEELYIGTDGNMGSFADNIAIRNQGSAAAKANDKLDEFWNGLRETEKQKLQYAWGQAAIYNLANADQERQPLGYGIGAGDLDFGSGLNAAGQFIADGMLEQALKDMQTKVGHMDFAGHTIETQEDAQQALDAINEAIVSKDKIRAHLGAAQNRLENTVSNLNIQAENLQAAESRISDVDVATEMTQFVRNQILTQSAVAMLSQANSLPQMAMQLIGG